MYGGAESSQPQRLDPSQNKDFKPNPLFAMMNGG
jgi:hypothetical protein